MGCASSKQSNNDNKRCKHCQTPYSPVPRSYSMHVIHPPQHKSDSYHLVALTSTTLGSLKLDPASNGEGEVDSANATTGGDEEDGLPETKSKNKEEFAMGLIEAKTWSKMIEEKIPRVDNHPRTPIMTPPGEPETINTWELMEGLEEDHFTTPCRFASHIRSFSFDVNRDPTNIVIDSPKLSFNHQVTASHFKVGPIEEADAESELEEGNDVKKKPTTTTPHENDGEDYFDSNIISMFRKSMQELSPSHPYHLKKQVKEKEKDRVVVYFTSLRGVRKTYEDSCYVRVILKGAGVRVDERDVSMHSGFKEELKQLLGGGGGGGFSLPKVFIGKKYIGGAEEVRRLHEEGQLEKAVEGCEKAATAAEDGGCGGGGCCEACGDIRFVPCETCNGSCKIYYEEEEEEEEEEVEEEDEEGLEGEGNGGDYGFQRCPDCNENGLIRCPICCY